MKGTIASFIAAAMLSAVVYPLFPERTYTIGNLLQLYFLILASYKFYSAHICFPETNAQRKTWLLMSATMFVWTLAQALEWYCEAILQLVAYGTIADCLWLLGYLPLWAALASQAREFRNTMTGKEKSGIHIRAGVPVLILFGILFGTIIMGQIMDPSQGWFMRILDFCYPSFDFIILFLALVLWQSARLRKAHATPWLLIIASALITAAGDVILSTITDFDSMVYITIDVYYFSSYFFLALAGDSAARGAARYRATKTEMM